MRVDHSSFHIFMTQQLLNRTNIITTLEQVRGKAVTKGMATHRLVCKIGQASGGTHGFLKAALIGMVAAQNIRAWVEGDTFGREDVLPGPLTRGVGVFLFEGIWQVHGSVALLEILLMDLLDAGKMFSERRNQALREHGHTVFFAFAIADHQILLFKVDIFDSQANTFNEAQARTVENFCHQLVNAGEGIDHTKNFIFTQDGRKALGLLGSHSGDIIEGLAENFTIEKENGAERLISLAPTARTVWVEAATLRWVAR
jgi:hypothetical protein